MGVKISVKGVLDIPPSYCGDQCPPLTVGEDIVTVFCDRTTVGVWKPGDPCDKRALLTGHRRKVTAMCLSPSDNRYLCTCSADQIFIWDLQTPGRQAQDGILVGVDLGFNTHCVFSWTREWLALCREKLILVIALQFSSSDDGEERLQGISTQGTINTASCHNPSCSFSPQHTDLLITVEENYFKVWNVAMMTQLWQSSSYGLEVLSFCEMDKTRPRLVLGTNKGTVHVLNTWNLEHAPPWTIFSADVDKIFIRTVSDSQQVPGAGMCACGEEENPECEQCSSKLSCLVFSARLFHREQLDEPSEEAPSFLTNPESTATYKQIVAPGSVLAVCCNLGLVFYDCKSAECIASFSFFDFLFDISVCLIDFVVLGGDSLTSLRCVLRDSSLDQRLRVLDLCVEDLPREDKGTSVISDVPVAAKCPLRSQLTGSRESVYEQGTQERGDGGHRRTRSSGYGRPVPRVQMFVPRTNQTQAALPRRSPGQCLLKTNSATMNQCGPPTSQRERVRIWDTFGTAITLAASGNGRILGCSSTLSDICLLKFEKLNLVNSVNLFGHNGAVNSLHFSLDSRFLISASNDASAKVWDWAQKKCVLNINKASRLQYSQSKTQDDHVGPITAARFYYMDQFLLLSVGGTLELYCHRLHEPSVANRLATFKQNYKRVHRVALPAQHLTCFTAANQFHSYLVLAGCSNKTVQVYDMNAQRFGPELTDVHTRPPHRIKQLTGSGHVTLHTAMYDLFVTAAVCDGAKVWDLRTSACAQKYTRHCNRSYTCGLDVSPCGRYLAVCSEDKSVYVYDTRKCEDYLGKLTGLGDVAMDVVFNPRFPVLAAAALSGHVSLYS